MLTGRSVSAIVVALALTLLVGGGLCLLDDDARGQDVCRASLALGGPVALSLFLIAMGRPALTLGLSYQHPFPDLSPRPPRV
jgi:hypothetical protein